MKNKLPHDFCNTNHTLVDWEKSIEINGDLSTAKEMLDLFKGHISEYEAKLKENISNSEKLKEILHIIRGEASYCCIHSIVELCDRLIAYAEQKANRNIRSNLTKLLDEMRKISSVE